jgi:putative transposon-encoded protein
MRRGNGAIIYVPKKWMGFRVRLERLGKIPSK